MKKPASPVDQLDHAAMRRLKKGIHFLNNWLAFCALAVLATVTTILFIVGSQDIAAAENAANVWQQFCLVAPLAVAAVVSTRTGGLDLSVGGIMALSAMIFVFNASAGNAAAGFILALIVCIAVGFLNGLFIMVMRIPAILVTIASAMLTRGIAMWGTNSTSVTLPAEWMDMKEAAAVIALVVSVGIAILLLWRTGRF
ncbi:MAG: hypothetical protein VB081_07530, partial [Christensenella sp.]